MRKFIIGLLFSMLFLFGLFIMVNIPYAKGITDDVDYTFENDVMYSGDGDFENTTWNLRNETIYTSIYNGTFTFSDEPDGETGTDIDFIDYDNSGAGCTPTIIHINQTHGKILECYDLSGSNRFEFYNSFSAQTSGVIEFYWLVSDNTERFDMIIRSGASDGIHFIVDTTYQYHNGIGWQNTGFTPNNNEWYHHRIEFDCSPDEFDWYIGADLIVDDGDFRNNQVSLNRLQFYSETSFTDYYNVFDAFGYTWDTDYNIGDNLIAYNYDESIYEVAGYEFAYDEDGVIYAIGTDNPSGWSDVEASGDRVNIVADSDYDRMVRFTGDTSGVFGLEKEFDVDEGIINITSEFYVDLNELNGYLEYNIYSYDDTLITRIRFVQEATYPSTDIVLYYYDGSSYIELYEMEEGIIEDYVFHNSFNLYINNYDGLCILSLDYYGSRWYQTFAFPIITDSEGLGKIKCSQEMPTGSPTSYSNIDSIGVLINGSSIADWGFPYVCYNLTEYTGDSWNLEEYNLFTLNATGIFSFYILGNFMGATNPTDYLTYNETERVFNLGNYTDTYVGWESYLYFRMNATSISSFEIHSLDIKGVKLTEGTNEYYLELDYDNVNISENYFYVNNERLYFTLDIEDDSIEYIQATFDINDEMCRNGTIKYKSYYIGYNLPLFDIEFTDESIYYYPFSYAGKIQRYILPQEYVIEKFIVNISDYVYDNVTNNLESGYIDGYITDISLIFVWDIDLTLTISTLISGIIPLLVILLPTFAVATIFKEQGSKIILPMLMVMTFICYAGQLIPLWLFGSLLVNYGLLFIINRRSGEV